MASPLFCHRLLNDLSLKSLFGIHLLETTVLVLKLAQPGHQRSVHTAELGAPLAKGRGADAMLTTQLRRRTASLGLLENGDDLAV